MTRKTGESDGSDDGALALLPWQVAHIATAHGANRSEFVPRKNGKTDALGCVERCEEPTNGNADSVAKDSEQR